MPAPGSTSTATRRRSAPRRPRSSPPLPSRRGRRGRPGTTRRPRRRPPAPFGPRRRRSTDARARRWDGTSGRGARAIERSRCESRPASRRGTPARPQARSPRRPPPPSAPGWTALRDAWGGPAGTPSRSTVSACYSCGGGPSLVHTVTRDIRSKGPFTCMPPVTRSGRPSPSRSPTATVMMWVGTLAM